MDNETIAASKRRYRAAVLGDGALALWRLGEISGTTAADETGNYNGTYVGGFTSVDGVTQDGNKAVSFNGSSQYVNCGNILALDRLTPFTFEAWVKTTNTGVKVIWDKFATFGISFSVGNTGTGRFFLTLRNTAGSNEIQVRTDFDTGITDGNWHHVVLTYAGTSNASGVALYINGVSKTLSIATNNLTSSIANTVPMCIGARNPAIAPWDGSIDEVAIYPTALSAAQALAHYNAR